MSYEPCSYSDTYAEIMRWADSGGDVLVDLDGTIAEHDWAVFSPYVIGKPIPLMVARIKFWLYHGVNVKIFTARACDADAATIAVIQDWSEKVLGARLEVTCKKDYNTIRIFDDRAVGVVRDTGEIVGDEDREELCDVLNCIECGNAF